MRLALPATHAMFRLTERCGSGGIVLKLEGRCSADVVDELDRSWRAVMRKRGNTPVWVDLSDLWRVDQAGEEIPARMHRDGAQLIARGCLMREVIREIKGSR